MKYAFVECQRRQHAVRTLCTALHVSPSGYYAARSRSPSARDQRQSSLTSKIRDVHLASRQTYGAPRVHAELSVQGIACCRNTVAKLMRRAQIVPKAIRRFRVTTDSRNTKEVFPNLVRRCFKAERPNTCWLSDVTYIPTREGWLYLAAVLDVYSRAIVGWAMSPHAGRPAGDRRARYGHFPTWRSRARAFGSRLNLRYLAVLGSHQETRDSPEHEPQRQLLGQRADGKLLPYSKDRARNALRLQDQGPSTRQPVRLHGSFLQPPASPLHRQIRGSASLRGINQRLIGLSNFRG
jgi:transposase InsO family protein